MTKGHIDLVERGLALFGGVTVAVAQNSQKQALFSVGERISLLREVLPDAADVTAFGGLVVDFCAQEGYQVILRGLRTVVDFEFEYQMALTNRHLRDDIETVFVMPSAEYAFIASSLIKDIVRNGGDVSDFVPAVVERRMREKLGD